MKTPTYEDARLLPLLTEEAIEVRVGELIGRANIRQLWLLFLDEESVQLPLLIPIDELPADPTDDATNSVISNLRELMDNVSAESIVLVWERYGSPNLTAQDAAWARSLAGACSANSVDLRSMLLSHRTGVRRIDPAEYHLAGG
jgi:hypothetical protein